MLSKCVDKWRPVPGVALRRWFVAASYRLVTGHAQCRVALPGSQSSRSRSQPQVGSQVKVKLPVDWKSDQSGENQQDDPLEKCNWSEIEANKHYCIRSLLHKKGERYSFQRGSSTAFFSAQPSASPTTVFIFSVMGYRLRSSDETQA
jgi:hypothetical protein